MGRTGSMRVTTTGGVSVRSGGLTDAEEGALADYFTNSGGVNQWLRGLPKQYLDRPLADLRRFRDLLDSAIAKGRLASDQTLYRVASLDRIPQVGDIRKERAFVSTSRSGRVAVNFAQHRGDVLFRIRAPKGAKGMDVSHFAGGSEHETLLPRGSTMRITKVRHAKHLVIVDAVLEK